VCVLHRMPVYIIHICCNQVKGRENEYNVQSWGEWYPGDGGEDIDDWCRRRMGAFMAEL
jgi:hypothetical protein